ncbi:MAG: hypothetical protein LC624_06005, partial [Halobacteriales archaeon]|nr:hypothetical protein [Halobacteriales archaeon]
MAAKRKPAGKASVTWTEARTFSDITYHKGGGNDGGIARIALAALLLLLPPALAVTPPIPVFVAGKCALVDLQVGEDQ